jgi:hypothetical protein
MSTSMRTWLASIGLLFSAIVLTSEADPQFLGSRAMLALVVLFSHAWIIAVGERACPNRGGVDIPRFPLGPRLLSVRPGLLSQCLVPVMMLGVVTRNYVVLGVGVAVVLVLTTDVLRQSMIWLLPAVAVVMGLLTMDEFHTLGDLVTSAQHWVAMGVLIGLWALVLSGTLLRTDVAGLKPKGRLVANLASLPGYYLAFFVLTRTSFAGTQPDLLGLMAVLLAGGVLQTMVIGFLARSAEIKVRSEREFPSVNAVSIGIAMMPMLLCVTAMLVGTIVSMGPAAEAISNRSSWVGLMAFCLIIPLVPAVGLVSSALDRVDGRGSRRGRLCSIAGLIFWVVAGPAAMTVLYSPEGPLTMLRGMFPPVGGWQPIVAEVGGSSFLLGETFGGDLMLFGMPAADMCRSVTLMVACCALLTAGYVRHAACGLRGTTWGTVFISLGLQVLGIVLLQPRIGAVAAALVTAATCFVMHLVDKQSGEEVEEGEDVVCAFNNFDDDDELLDEDDEPGVLEPGHAVLPPEVSSESIGLDLDDEELGEPIVEPVSEPVVGVDADRSPGVPVEVAGDTPPGAGVENGADFAIDMLPDDPFFNPPVDSPTHRRSLNPAPNPEPPRIDDQEPDPSQPVQR